MKLIVGLGNPGKQYEKTRHNLGFMVVDEIVQRSKCKDQNDNSKFKMEKKFQAQIYQLTNDTLVVKPQTYMNNSGLAVSLLASYFKLSTSDLWVIHDDLDLPLCSMKIRFGGASAGHHGVESIIGALNTDKFWRFRIGIGEQSSKLSGEDYVLENFKDEEMGKVKEIVKKGSDAVKYALEEGLKKAMNRYNNS